MDTLEDVLNRNPDMKLQYEEMLGAMREEFPGINSGGFNCSLDAGSTSICWSGEDFRVEGTCKSIIEVKIKDANCVLKQLPSLCAKHERYEKTGKTWQRS